MYKAHVVHKVLRSIKHVFKVKSALNVPQLPDNYSDKDYGFTDSKLEMPSRSPRDAQPVIKSRTMNVPGIQQSSDAANN